MHELQADIFREPDYVPVETPYVGGVLDPKLDSKLMQIFVGHFGPWVSIYFPSDVYNDTKQSQSLLHNTACLLASRYMPGVASPVVQAMYLQIRQELMHSLWGPLPLKFEVLQAIALLCLWPTHSVQNGPPMDSWLLSGIALDHALMSFDFLKNAPYERVVDNDMVSQLRLWNALCLARVQSSVAHARPFHIPQRYLDHCPRLLEHPAATFEDGKVVAEIQLYLITLRLQRNYQRMRVSDIEYEELERWKVDWAHLLNGEENSTIELNLWFCQILLHRTAMKFQFDTERLSLEVIQLSRLIVSKVLQARLSTALGFIDHVYVILGYATLNLCDANTLDPLIEDIQMYLLRLSPNERHITYRYSCMIADFKQRCAESQLAFGDAQARKADAEQMQLVHPLVNAMGDGCPPWSQIIPDFVAQSYPDASGIHMYTQHGKCGITPCRSGFYELPVQMLVEFSLALGYSTLGKPLSIGTGTLPSEPTVTVAQE
ncbi:alpha-amylase A precursor [Aspergillus terreus NIH2624]|uniref:Alpha-amylase A n=1 Tax=Aspergillus terreus (strain NIH 2624 / FGSC A1156) TaxID=341663 RepID=Q0D009_ASPTN|nr:alpha-amylase A precursor [Aspergillus terreus NIH2624]EAU39371.1 alpha-amylase A precursor [Aspergillus terreus NIH2624]